MTDEKFDPYKHKFGMAYLDGYFIVYPTFHIENQDGKIECHWNDHELLFIDPDNLIRAPEQDLVPRADVEVLLEIINVYHYGKSVNALKFTRLVEDTITRYRAKHGE